MGFSSYNCLGCGYSIRSEHACHTMHTLWMVQTTVLPKKGRRIQGAYDGYGRVITNAERETAVDLPRDDEYASTASVYHTACWELLGRPGFTVPSQRADDQGYFCDTFPREPKTVEDLTRLQNTKAEQTAAQKTEQTALKSLQRLSELVDRPTLASRLVRVVADDPTSIGVLNTASYEKCQERILIVQPTTIPDVVELWYQDGAGYDGLIGTLTLAKDGQKGVR